MKMEKYRDFVAHKGMSPVKRERIGEYEVFISEGYCRGDLDYKFPHYKTMYAIGYDADRVEVGEFLTTPIVFPMPLQEERMAETMMRAGEFILGLKETGCLKS